MFAFPLHHTLVLHCEVYQDSPKSIFVYDIDKYRDNSLGKIHYVLNSVCKYTVVWVEAIYYLVYLCFFSKYFCDVHF